ncbi:MULTISPECIES: pyrroline-5-carboxylate reductase [Bacillus cereus group]|uniref:Pyrroline-5-carboxylate reductase n=1 Tax=Bacillus cytotoxicus (strain DSM 22905 / CIP 110041 / 391-98 / NVH 391-98) TaxID=315749 RepID=A7GKA6_BACCN|nr:MULTISPECIES: pyrroline-5-carboxylate reductase [Bacillus cereus group]ABS20564.1 pyrroline-5-carboxylate reductase [Bacillus cytotoxicus NVH 391-98]AWC27199.1 pyrroline-5-carboxylate reductase [Bacillus cytotoxicus]AWC39312.1 pyrroline-5-carboxylate reductase [Bacillus cytotoxicus]AWC43311.1 pyrroline-5-carboxylate reductase [Bacillus cytotoxicus]AWC47243.1 pyrroline-5-carboxylate reductase [Bacillus cytotoxicus]
MPKKQRILFIGAGRMAEAIFSGLLKTSKPYIEEIIVSNRHNTKKLQQLQEQYPISTTTDWKECVKFVDTIILAMPPAAHEQLLTELAPLLTHQLVVTIAAGIGPSYLEKRLPHGTPVAWIMPNTAASIGQSISLYTTGHFVNENHKETLQLLLKGIGTSQLCTEEEIHQLTAITGSAPAFLYHFAESLIEATKNYGIDETTAHHLVIQMIAGAATMLGQVQNPALLREQVTTPGGSTAEGLKVLYEHHFSKIIQQAIEATNKKVRGK